LQLNLPRTGQYPSPETVIPRAATTAASESRIWFRGAGDLLLVGDCEKQIPRANRWREE